MKIKVLAVIAVICICLLGLVACTNSSAIIDGGFNNFSEDGSSLTEWEKFETKNSATRTLTFPTIAAGSDQAQSTVTGKYAKFVISSSNSTLLLTQKIVLDKGAKYKLSYSINIPSNISVKTDGFAAYVGFREEKDFTLANHKNKTASWERKDVYFTVEKGGEYTLALGIGSLDTDGARGTAEFDNIAIEKVDAIPDGITAGTINKSNVDTYGGTVTYVVLLALASLVIVMFGYLLTLRAKYNSFNGIAPKSKLLSSFAKFIYIMTGAFLIRLLIVLLTDGMGSELAELGTLALNINKRGIPNIYSYSNTTMPLGIMYILSLVGAIGSSSELVAGSFGMNTLLRLPLLICDLVNVYLVFAIVSKFKSTQLGVNAAGVYALIPIIFTLSSVWGMYMSISLTFLLCMAYFMVSKNHIGVSATYLGALLFSNYLIILAPLAILYAIYYFIVDKSIKSRVTIVVSAVGAVLLLYLISLPFTINYESSGNAFYIIKRMYGDLTANVFVSNSVFNMYAMFGLGTATASTATKVLTGIVMCIVIGLAIWSYLRHRNRLDFVLLAGLSLIIFTVFGIGARLEIMVMGIMLLMLYGFIREDSRVIHVSNTLSCLSFINVGALMITSRVFADGNTFTPFLANNWVYILGSILTVLTVAYLIKVTIDIMVKEKVSNFNEEERIAFYFERKFRSVSNFILNRK